MSNTSKSDCLSKVINRVIVCLFMSSQKDRHDGGAPCSLRTGNTITSIVTAWIRDCLYIEELAESLLFRCNYYFG